MENQNTNKALELINSDKFDKMFDSAEKSEKLGVDIATTPLFKIEKGETKTVFFTGHYRDILFQNAPEPKKCPIVVEKDKVAKCAPQAVIVSAFSRENYAEGFYKITCTGEEKNANGKYQTFEIKQVNL